MLSYLSYVTFLYSFFLIINTKIEQLEDLCHKGNMKCYIACFLYILYMERCHSVVQIRLLSCWLLYTSGVTKDEKYINLSCPKITRFFNKSVNLLVRLKKEILWEQKAATMWKCLFYYSISIFFVLLVLLFIHIC
jgi:hypothetical protein